MRTGLHVGCKVFLLFGCDAIWFLGDIICSFPDGPFSASYGGLCRVFGGGGYCVPSGYIPRLDGHTALLWGLWSRSGLDGGAFFHGLSAG